MLTVHYLLEIKYKLRFQRPMWVRTRDLCGRAPYRIQPTFHWYDNVHAYYNSDQSSKLSIPVVVQFATNVDIVCHNYNNTKLIYVRLYGK